LRQGPVDPVMEVQDEISGCAFDSSYELIYNGRPCALFVGQCNGKAQQLIRGCFSSRNFAVRERVVEKTSGP